MVIFGYRTKKTPKGFLYEITKGKERKEPNKKGQYLDTSIIHTGIKPTRAKALGISRRYVEYYRQERNKKK